MNGRITWILDAYTTSDQYPYSQTYSGDGGLSSGLNYVRNSVKATVDGYDGTVHFYVIDRKDPMVRSYREAFPDLFSDFSKMPAALRAHLRYPENLFKLQSDVFSKYHVTNTSAFYAGTGRWLLSPDPNSVLGATVTPTTNRGTQRAPEITATTQRQDPYYLYIRLPGDTRENFLLLQPFVPVSQNNQQTRLSSFMTAKSDPANYGQRQAFVMPQGSDVNGPVQVANNIQLIPVGNSIVYVQPIFVQQNPQQGYRNSIVYVQPIFVQQGTQQGYPVFKFVVVFTQGKNPVFSLTGVNDALAKLFGGVSLTPATPTTPSTPTTPGNPTVQSLLTQAAQKFTDADTALKAGDLATYQTDIRQGEDLVRRAQSALNGGSGGSGSTTPSSSATAAAFRGRP